MSDNYIELTIEEVYEYGPETIGLKNLRRTVK